MTALKKLQQKYPPQSDASLTRKKREFNCLLQAMRDLEQRDPFDQVGYDALVKESAALFEYLAARCTMPDNAAVKGFAL